MKIYRFLLAALLALTVILILAAPASAAIGTPQWSGETFSGADAFYGNVVAYTVGSTAKVTVPVTNNDGQGCDIDIKGAKILVNGLGEFTTTDFPASIAAGKTDYVRFSFTVPEPAANTTASYSYRIYVWYDRTNDTAQGIHITAPAAETVGAANGAAVWYLDHLHVIANSLTLTVGGTANTAYTCDWENAKITFTTPPASGTIVADYWYYHEFTPVDSTVNLAVYSSEQADAVNLRQQLAVLVMGTGGTAYSGYTGWNGVNENVRQRLAEAEQQIVLGDQSYAAGDFTAAGASYAEAMILLDKAKEQDADVNRQNLEIPSIAVWVAGFGVLIFGLGAMLFAFKWKVKE